VSDPKILSPLAGSATRWAPSSYHHLNWLEGILANRQPIAPVDQSARSLEACAAAWISMKLKRKLTWDAATERFVGDDEANALRGRKARKPAFATRLSFQREAGNASSNVSALAIKSCTDVFVAGIRR
jgi:hypothetical protein